MKLNLKKMKFFRKNIKFFEKNIKFFDFLKKIILKKINLIFRKNKILKINECYENK